MKHIKNLIAIGAALFAVAYAMLLFIYDEPGSEQKGCMVFLWFFAFFICSMSYAMYNDKDNL